MFLNLQIKKLFSLKPFNIFLFLIFIYKNKVSIISLESGTILENTDKWNNQSINLFVRKKEIENNNYEWKLFIDG